MSKLYKFLSLSCIALSVVSCTQHSTKEPFVLKYNKKIPVSVAREDLNALKQILEEAQTSLYMYTSPEKLDSVFQSVNTFPEDSVSYLDFVRRIARYQNTIACGHSGWGHPKAYKTYRKEHMRFFPFNIKIQDQKYYINDADIAHKFDINGAEILRINGISVEEVSNRLRQHMVKDGFSNPYGVKEIEIYFRMAYSNFIDNPETFTLTLNTSSEPTKKMVIQALSLSKIDSLHQSNKPVNTHKKALDLKITSDNIGILDINSFRNGYIEHFGQTFVPYIDSVFQVLDEQHIQSLVIDLRGNTGGWTANGKHLFSYFIEEPMEYMQKVEVKKHEQYSFDSLIVSPPGYMDTFDLVLNANGLYEWKNYPSLKAIPHKHHRYKGKVYIMVDEMSRSCSAVFSALMQDHTEATLVGKETGASKCGSSAMVMAITLPNTKIPVHFSTARYYTNVKYTNNCRGIIPDIKTSHETDSEEELNALLYMIKEKHG